MAVVTKGNEGKDPMAGDAKAGGEPESRRRPEEGEERAGLEYQARGAPGAPKRGFFRIHKRGQGYWTRMGTAVASVALILLVAQFIYVTLDTRTPLDTMKVVTEDGQEQVKELFPAWKLGIVGVLALAGLLTAWHYQNKPSVVDFLIATESEMKKVNWTSWKDLVGSTKVVILFMFLIAAILFVVDIVFAYIFWLIGVLKQAPGLW